MTYRENAAIDEGVMVVGFYNHVFGVDARTGERLWARDLVGSGPRIAVTADRVYVCTTELLCLTRATGELVWRNWDVPFSPRNPSLLVRGDSVFVAGTGQVACFEAENGALRWHDPFRGMGNGPVALGFSDGVVQGDRDT